MTEAPRTSLTPMLLASLVMTASVSLSATDTGVAAIGAREIMWGEESHGLRLHVDTDRRTYRRTRDLVNVTFVVQNTTAREYPITLALTAEERTDLLVTDGSGRQRLVRGFAGRRLATEARQASLRPEGIARLNMLLDPEEQGLQPGPYRLQGIFRYSGPNMATWIQSDFRLLSNEVSFEVTEASKHEQAWLAGRPVGGGSLTLLAGAASWRAGDPPIPFTVVYNRLESYSDTRQPISIYGLTYYRLEVTDPDGAMFEVPQAVPLPSSLSAHFRFAKLPPGKSVGERLSWDPGGSAVRRTVELDELVQVPGLPAHARGRFRVRAVYEVDTTTEARLGYKVQASRLVSNAVDVNIH